MNLSAKNISVSATLFGGGGFAHHSAEHPPKINRVEVLEKESG